MCLLPTCVCVCAVCATQGAIAAVERRHADELREELQDTRDLCAFYQQENEELNMVSLLYQRQLEALKQRAAPTPAPGEEGVSACGTRLEGAGWVWEAGLQHVAPRFGLLARPVAVLLLSAALTALVSVCSACPCAPLCSCVPLLPHPTRCLSVCVLQPRTGTTAGSGCQQPVSSGSRDRSAAAGTTTGSGSRRPRATRAQACGTELLRGPGTAGWQQSAAGGEGLMAASGQQRRGSGRVALT